MLELLLTLALGGLLIYVVALILPGVAVTGFGVALAVAVVLAVINALLKPILVVLTLPINIMTLGLFTLVINASLILLADWIVPGFDIANFWWAVLFGLILGLFNGVMNLLAKK